MFSSHVSRREGDTNRKSRLSVIAPPDGEHDVPEEPRCFEDGERALDMFAGVGPFVVPFAKRGARAVGVDLNDDSIAYLRANARRNGVADCVTAIHGDVRTLVSDSPPSTAGADAEAGQYRERNE